MKLIEKAWNFVIETNQMLRTLYRWEDIEKPIQIVLKNFKVNLIVHDLSKENSEFQKRILNNIKERDLNEKLNIKIQPFRILLCKIDERKYEMIISNHHILYDGWSNGIILKEFIDAYNCFYEEKEPIKTIKNGFKDYIKWNSAQDKNKQKNHWEKYFDNIDFKGNVFGCIGIF